MSNSASRLYDIVQRLNAGDQSKSTLEQWMRILQLEGPHAHEIAIDAMQAATAEVRRVESQLQRMGAPENLFSKAAEALRHGFNPVNGGVAWRDAGQRLLTGLANNPLQWAAWVTRGYEDPDIEGAAAEALLASIEQLERLLAEGEYTEEIHQILADATTKLRRALRLSVIKGAEGLATAANQAVTSLATVDPEAVKHASQQDLKAVNQSVSVFREAAEAAKAGTAFIDLFTKTGTMASNLIGYAQNLLSGPQ